MKHLRALWLAFAVVFTASTVRSYGPDGHALVGAVADQLLQEKYPAVASKITLWLEGISLEDAANLPDKIKSWDNPEGPRNKWFHLPDHPKIEEQLRDFWRANPHLVQDPPNHDAVPNPDHHWFHFVDIPALKDEKYSDGTVGRSRWDVVHMITYCAKVLHGDVSENNDRKITKTVAVILIVHYVGDIHQPLHVGAEYFAANATPVEPAAGKVFYDDEGGNKLLLKLLDRATDGNSDAADDEEDEPSGSDSRFALKLHGFWDSQSVVSARHIIKAQVFSEQPGHSKVLHNVEYVSYLAKHIPAEASTSNLGTFDHWSEAWADEIQHIAREAHERLTFAQIKISAKAHTITSGTATEKDLDESYDDWVGKIVVGELAKAGSRLTDLLGSTISP